LPEAERVCACGHALHEAGEDKSEQLEIHSAQIKSLSMCRLNMAAVPVKMVC